MSVYDTYFFRGTFLFLVICFYGLYYVFIILFAKIHKISDFSKYSHEKEHPRLENALELYCNCLPAPSLRGRAGGEAIYFVNFFPF